MRLTDFSFATLTVYHGDLHIRVIAETGRSLGRSLIVRNMNFQMLASLWIRPQKNINDLAVKWGHFLTVICSNLILTSISVSMSQNLSNKLKRITMGEPVSEYVNVRC